MPPDLSHLVPLPAPRLAEELRRALPGIATGPGRAAVDRGTHAGGRTAAVRRLDAIDPVDYARSRNHVDGAVTGLSPWIRHGVLSLAEVRDAALARVAMPVQATKLVSELGWREYWRQVHAVLGDAILTDIEPAAAPRRGAVLDAVPDDVLEARTGMHCIDAFVRGLHATGWLHNHERMWLASWLIHVRGVRWRAGADWFLEHLLDGDPASNHLSWQWIAGTFSARPYVFNREILDTFTSGRHCGPCPLRGRCDLEGSTDDLAATLFESPPGDGRRPAPRLRAGAPTPAAAAVARPLVWLTLDSLSESSPAALAHPGAPRLFVLDPAWLAAERPSLKRLVFVFQCLAEVPSVEVLLGDPAALVAARAAARGCDGVAVAETPCPRVRQGIARIAASLPVAVVRWPAFCDGSGDLGRFSRWWRDASASALRPTAR